MDVTGHRIVTLCMNPALDITTSTEVVRPTAKLRCGEARYDPGGGGINVSRVLARMGMTARAYYCAGGPAGVMTGAVYKAATSAVDQLVGHQRVYSHASLEHDLRAGGYKVMEKTGFFLKPVANSMMLGYSNALLVAMNEIGPQLPMELLANIGVVAVRAD